MRFRPMFLHEIARPYTQINQKPVFTSCFDVFRHPSYSPNRGTSSFHFFPSFTAPENVPLSFFCIKYCDFYYSCTRKINQHWEKF